MSFNAPFATCRIIREPQHLTTNGPWSASAKFHRKLTDFSYTATIQPRAHGLKCNNVPCEHVTSKPPKKLLVPFKGDLAGTSRCCTSSTSTSTPSSHSRSRQCSHSSVASVPSSRRTERRTATPMSGVGSECLPLLHRSKSMPSGSAAVAGMSAPMHSWDRSFLHHWGSASQVALH